MEQMASEKHKNQDFPDGYVLRVSGTIIDVQFPREAVPDIFNELKVVIPETSMNARRALRLHNN